ncbi:MAG: hypothetical protein GQ576_04495 [Methanococcoides sp.]|nr:hypothetical protein [Methanococcoides sp.]
MNIADKIGVYLLLSIVFILIGGIAGQILPGTEATEMIIVSFAVIGLVALVGSLWELIIACIETASDIFYKRYESGFTNILRVGQMTVYSVVYVSLMPLIGYNIYEEGGSIYSEANEFMIDIYSLSGDVFSIVIVAFIVLVTMEAFANYIHKGNE